MEKTIEAGEVTNNEYEMASVAVDQQSGSVYVLGIGGEGKGIRVFKRDAQGAPSPFTDPSLSGSAEISVSTHSSFFNNSSIAVDNSGGPFQGRIYVRNAYTPEFVWAYEPSGAEVHGNFPLFTRTYGLATDPSDGNFFCTCGPLVERSYEFGPDGKKTGVTVDMSQFAFTYDEDIAVGPDGDVYGFSGDLGIERFNDKSELVDHVPAEFSSVIGVDPVGGDLKSVRYSHLADFDPNGNELPGYDYGEEGRSIAINGVSHYEYIIDYYGLRVIKPEPATTIPSAGPTPPTEIEPTSLTLNAELDPEGVTTTECNFELGTLFEYGTYYYDKSVPCEQGQAIGGGPTPVSAHLTGLSQGATYHYRLVVGNGNGAFKAHDRTVSPSDLPVIEDPYVDTVHSDSVLFHAEITPEGAPTSFHVLYGTGDCSTEPQACVESPETSSIGKALLAIPSSFEATGLSAGTTYHYIVFATNQSGTTESLQQSFTTFPYNPVLEDKCANSHVRQQTGAAPLGDCRAYELVSAAVARYDVESYLTPEQEPFGGYPYADSKVLYGVHDGAIPGSGNPTNHGVDPYVATRGSSGWNTAYVGVPANMPYSSEAFASPVAGADAALDTFAFGGAGLCSPCFSDGSTGIPVGLPDGSLVQGMKGSQAPGGAKPDILVRKPLSADGRHLVFGSTSEFEGGAGSPAIYDRDLTTGVTHAVSTLPGGGAIPCTLNCTSDGLAELDISADGSRIVIGQLVSVDSAGNRYWHLYMNVGDSAGTIDLTPGATDGALYDGMTKDGTTLYFTTADHITGASGDSDNSADLYEAQVGPASSTLHLASLGSGGSGDTDACNPLRNSVNQHWNSTAASADCGIVAIGGAGGVAATAGTTYFLSPELLDGNSEPQDGSVDQPNLYRYQPGSSPHFVATLDSSATGPAELLEEHRFKKFFSSTARPEFVAVDGSGGPSDGDVYVADGAENKIRKYDAEGSLITSWKSGGVMDAEFTNDQHEIAGIAVGPDGGLWVANHMELNSCCDIRKYDEDGNLLRAEDMDGAAAPIGIAVDSHERVFYQSYYYVERFKSGTSTPVTAYATNATGVAVDPTSGTFYADFGGIEVGRFAFDGSERVIEPNGAPCTSECEPTASFGFGELNNAGDMFVDPTRHELYVDQGNRILRFHGDGRRAAGPDTGAKVLSNSNSVSVGANGNLYATNAGSEGTSVAAFGPLVLAPDPRTDNPMIINSVNDSGTRHTGDFQITPDGDDGVFVTTVPLTGYTNAGHEEVFRYDSPGDAVACMSCNPTGARAVGESSLARNGLSLADDGRVFFNSSDALLPTDLDNREDVFEWSGGRTTLISTGLSPFNSSLLSAGADGRDVYFFTRDTLVKQDLNGSLVKIYDARENGGFPYTPPAVDCKASDECHGAGSPQPAPAAVNTITGTRGNSGPAAGGKCPKGKVKRQGRCVKPKKGHKHKKRTARSTGGSSDDGIQGKRRGASARSFARPGAAPDGARRRRHRTRDGGHRRLLDQSLDQPGGRAPRPADHVRPRQPRCAAGGRERHHRNAWGDFRKPERGRTVHVGRLRPAGMPADLAGGPDHRPRPLRRHLQLPPGHGPAVQHPTLGSGDGPLRVPRAEPEHPDSDTGCRQDRE